jgi:hypothetical protein
MKYDDIYGIMIEKKTWKRVLRRKINLMMLFSDILGLYWIWILVSVKKKKKKKMDDKFFYFVAATGIKICLQGDTVNWDSEEIVLWKTRKITKTMISQWSKQEDAKTR